MSGVNAPSKEYIGDVLLRLENLAAQKSDIGDAMKAVFAEAKAAGYAPKYLRYLLRLRTLAPNEIAEIDAMTAIYRDAAGLGELPLFKQLGALRADTASQESVIEALKSVVPDKGHIIVEVAGDPVKLSRNAAGEVIQEVYKPPKPEAGGAGVVPASKSPRPVMAAPPDVDEAGAEALGAQAFRDDVPVIKNPFPAGDKRRRAWDIGWRAASGGDGMGPDTSGGGA